MTGSLTAGRLTVRAVEDFSAALGWDAEFSQISVGAFAGEVLCVETAHSKVTALEMSHATLQQGVTPEGYVTFGLPRPGGIRRFAGRRAEKARVMALHARSGFDCVTEDGLTAVTLSFTVKRLLEVGETMEIEVPPGLLNGALASQLVDPDKFRELYARAQRAVEGGSFDEVDVGLPTALLQLLSLAETERSDENPPNRRVRDRALARALEVIEAHPGELIRVERLCEASGATWRTLDRAFVEHFGMPPKRYQKRLQLNRLRRALRIAEPEATVAAVARNWGFTHASQLAHDYRALFGELPSRTLAR